MEHSFWTARKHASFTLASGKSRSVSFRLFSEHSDKQLARGDPQPGEILNVLNLLLFALKIWPAYFFSFRCTNIQYPKLGEGFTMDYN